MGEQLTLFDVKEHAQQERKSRADVFNDYDSFVEKFEAKRTTDDCYTPAHIYDCVKQWVSENADIAGRPIVRPFVPGGDFEHYAYPENCLVLDNPPFSIYAKIVRWYLEQDIDFFLFSPAITQLVAGSDVCYVCCMADVTYANGAYVRTSFTTNLFKGTRLWVCGDLKKRIDAAEKAHHVDRRKAKFAYPDNILTVATMGKVAERGVNFKVATDDCDYIRDLDVLKAEGKSLFGSGLILSPRAATERAEAEREAERRKLQESIDRGASSKLAAMMAGSAVLELSEREKIKYRHILTKE